MATPKMIIFQLMAAIAVVLPLFILLLLMARYRRRQYLKRNGNMHYRLMGMLYFTLHYLMTFMLAWAAFD